MDLNQLQDAIESYTQNNDWTGPVASDQAGRDGDAGLTPPSTAKDVIIGTQLNRIIKQAENKIYSIVKPPSAIKQVTGDIATTGIFSLTIQDFQKPISAVLTSSHGDAEGWNRLLHYKSPGLATSWGNTDVTVLTLSVPKYYSVLPKSGTVGEPVELTVFPFPSITDFDLTVNYYGHPESITEDASGKSWLGETAENLLLYGCLVEAYTFMKGDMDLLQGYKQKFDEAVQAFNQTTMYS